MNTPHPMPQETTKEKSQPSYQFAPLATIGILLCILLVVGVILTVRLEQQQQIKDQAIARTSSTPTPQQSLLPSPTPRATYQPQIDGMSKEEATKLFHAVTLERDLYQTEKHLARWESKKISWRLRGQFTSEDRQCLTIITKQFNAAMNTATLEELPNATASERRAGIEIYLLPPNQFSSVNPDIRPEQSAQLFYSRSGYSLTSADLVIDSTQAIGFRCYYLHDLMLQAVGIAFPLADKSLVGPITSPNFTYNARYSATDLEMLRILYSPLMTAGLTQTEIERRLLQPPS